MPKYITRLNFENDPFQRDFRKQMYAPICITLSHGQCRLILKM